MGARAASPARRATTSCACSSRVAARLRRVVDVLAERIAYSGQGERGAEGPLEYRLTSAADYRDDGIHLVENVRITHERGTELRVLERERLFALSDKGTMASSDPPLWDTAVKLKFEKPDTQRARPPRRRDWQPCAHGASRLGAQDEAVSREAGAVLPRHARARHFARLDSISRLGVHARPEGRAHDRPQPFEVRPRWQKSLKAQALDRPHNEPHTLGVQARPGSGSSSGSRHIQSLVIRGRCRSAAARPRGRKSVT